MSYSAGSDLPHPTIHPTLTNKTAGQIASTDTIVKTSLYIVHERIWAKVDWGRSYDVEYQI